MRRENGKVILTEKEYEDLIDDRDWRVAMENAGVDNWVGYEYGMDYYLRGNRED